MARSGAAIVGPILGVLLILCTGSITAAQTSSSNIDRETTATPPEHNDCRFCTPQTHELAGKYLLNDSNDAAQQSNKRRFSESLERFGADQKNVYLAPFHRSSILWDAILLGGTSGLIAVDKRASAALPQSHLNVSTDISDVGLIGIEAAAGGLWLSSFSSHDDRARETGVLSFEAFVNSASVYAVTQLLAGRERPLEGAGHGRFWQHNTLNSSFPSGHATFAWSTATIIAHEYPRPIVEWLAYGTATAVSVTRFTGRTHFPSDVVVGSVFGYLIGRYVFHTHCGAGRSPACKRSEN